MRYDLNCNLKCYTENNIAQRGVTILQEIKTTFTAVGQCEQFLRFDELC